MKKLSFFTKIKNLILSNKVYLEEIELLKSELTSSRKETLLVNNKLTDLHKKVYLTNKDYFKLLKLDSLSLEELKKISKFEVHKNDDDKDNIKWKVYKNICCLSGCDFNGATFDEEYSAYVYAATLTIQYGKVITRFACDECYKEYHKDCI